MLNKKLIMLTIIFTCLVAVSAVSAAENATEDIVTNASEDVVSVEDNIQVTKQIENEKTGGAGFDSKILSRGEEGNYTDLRNDIINGGILTKSTYYYRDGDGDTIQITESMTIDGNGAVIDMTGSTNMRAFSVSASGVTIKNLTIKNANYNGNGGAVYFVSDGDVRNCNFINNKVTGDYSDGGALSFLNEGTVTKCNFTNNSATEYGGAIRIYSGSVENCNFIGNKATNGDYNMGGAIDMSHGTVENCNFINNMANDGGAIRILSGSVENCNFINNMANDGGGAVLFNDGSTVTNCNFINNTAEYGGAIYGEGDVVNCHFINNFANDSGGAIYSDDEDYDWDVINCSFSNNHADYGGAIYNEYYRDYDDLYGWDGPFNGYRCGILNCSFVNNSADSGGAICGADDVMNCSFDSNNAIYYGGAVFDAENIENCLFINNSALGIYHGIIKDFVWYDGGEGGAISAANNIVNCSFVNNSAFSGIIIGFQSLDSYLSNKIPTYFTDDYFEDHSTWYFTDRYSGGLFDCNIHENALNNYGSIEVIDNELILSSLESNSYGLIVYISNEYDPDLIDAFDYYAYLYDYDDEYVPYFTQRYNKYDAHIDLNNLSEGNYYAYISLSNSTYVSSVNCIYESIVNIMVPITIKTKFDISSSDITKYYGGVEKYTLNLTKNNNPLANENVQITVNGKTSTVKTDSKGQATINLDLPVGTYDITSAYKNLSTTSKVTVKSTIATADATGTYLNSKVSATFLDVDGKALASKQVTFKVGDKTYTATTNSNGVATANIDLGAGPYTVTAINPVNNDQKQFKLMIDKANSAIALVSSQNNGVTTLTATLTPAAASGNVIFNVNGEDKSAAIKNGKATLTLSDLEPGDYAVTASYNGDSNLNSSASNTVTFNVAEVYPILTADPVTKTYGTSTKLVVNLVDSKGNAIANADVNVNISSKIVQITTDSSGQATMSINKAPGSYTAAITYLDAQTTAKIKVKKATPKLTAKAKTFKKSLKTKKYTVTLKTNTNKVMKNTKVTLKVNGKTYKATTNYKGQATFKITKLAKKGKFTAVVKYAGSKYYNAKTVKAKITVK